MNLLGWDAHSVTPTTDVLLWIRWFVSVVVIWWLPGWLLLRGRLQDWPQVTATYARLATGFVWLVVIGLAMRWLDQGLPPLLFAALSLILAFGLGRWLSPGESRRITLRNLPSQPAGGGPPLAAQGSSRQW